MLEGFAFGLIITWLAVLTVRSGLVSPPRSLPGTDRDIERRVKAIELEWEDVYDKLRRLAGRASKTVALDQGGAEPKVPAGQAAAPFAVRSRADVLRWHREQARTVQG